MICRHFILLSFCTVSLLNVGKGFSPRARVSVVASEWVSPSSVWEMSTSSAPTSSSSSPTDIVDVQVISDFACPWCYVGEARLKKALMEYEQSHPDARVRVSFRPYMIDRNTHPDGEDYIAYTRRRWGGDGWTSSLKRSSWEDGCEFSNWATWPNSLLAHCLQEFAARAGKADEVTSLLFQAIYERGQNVSDVETLAAIAEETNLSKEEARTFLSSREAEDAVLREDAHAKTELRVTGVPCFRVRSISGQANKQGVSSRDAGSGAAAPAVVLNGAVSPDQLVQAFESVSKG